MLSCEEIKAQVIYTVDVPRTAESCERDEAAMVGKMMASTGYGTGKAPPEMRFGSTFQFTVRRNYGKRELASIHAISLGKVR